MVTWERELAYLLEKESTLLNSLEECSEQKTGMLANGDVDALSKAVSKEQTLSLRFQAMETQRAALLKKYHMENKTLRESCRFADKEYKDVLESELESLCVVAKKLKKTNAFNNELTKSRLEFYGKVRAAITKPVYGYDGAASQKSQGSSSLIDRKI